jgi:hypothetical protein
MNKHGVKAILGSYWLPQRGVTACNFSPSSLDVYFFDFPSDIGHSVLDIGYSSFALVDIHEKIFVVLL